MSNPARLPPRHVADAAKVVDQWLKSVEPASRLSHEQIQRLTPAQRLDYSRQFDQASMPAWRDPRR
jgi:uncharacterized protein YeaO (DUF488 family)